MNKKIKCAFVSLALASTFALSAALSACTIKTDHPQVKITISFNGKTYDIEYKMYRNMYPQTVQHFIELADEGFYNDMIIHDYKAGSDWLTGAYAYNEPENNRLEGADYSDGEKLVYDRAFSDNALGEYLENNSKEEKYYELFDKGAITPTVYSKLSYKDDKNRTQYLADENKLPTLIGEFSENGHSIDNGALSAKFGALKMYYYDKGNSNNQVYINNWANQILLRDYKYNCATSVFAMQVGSSSLQASKYCVFAELKDENASEVLEDLIEAIDDYKNDEVGASKFTSSVTMRVDAKDNFVDNDIEVSFTMTSLPIIIKSVKITKY